MYIYIYIYIYIYKTILFKNNNSKIIYIISIFVIKNSLSLF